MGLGDLLKRCLGLPLTAATFVDHHVAENAVEQASRLVEREAAVTVGLERSSGCGEDEVSTIRRAPCEALSDDLR